MVKTADTETAVAGSTIHYTLRRQQRRSPRRPVTSSSPIPWATWSEPLLESVRPTTRL